KVQLLADVSDPVAPQVVQGLLQKVSFTAAPASMAAEGMSMFEKYAGPMTPAQRESTDRFLSGLDAASTAPSSGRSVGASIGLPLTTHLPGFIVMTVFTAAAAASFGLILATLSRSRQQLSGISTILILTMSALGGSMFPRFLMTQTMQKIGLVTFNAWALDGY